MELALILLAVWSLILTGCVVFLYLQLRSTRRVAARKVINFP